MATQMAQQLRPHPRAWPRTDLQPRFDKPSLTFNDVADGTMNAARDWWLSHASISSRNSVSAESPNYLDGCRTYIETRYSPFNSYFALLDDTASGWSQQGYINTYHAGGFFNIVYDAGPFVPGVPYKAKLVRVTVDDNPQEVTVLENDFFGDGSRQTVFSLDGAGVEAFLPIMGPAPVPFILRVYRTTEPVTARINEFRTAEPSFISIASAGNGSGWRKFANINDVQWREGYNQLPAAVQVAGSQAVSGREVLAGTMAQSQARVQPNRRSAGRVAVEVLDDENGSEAAVFVRSGGSLSRLSSFGRGASSYYVSGRNAETKSRFYSYNFPQAAGAGGDDIFDGEHEVFVVSEAPAGPLEFAGHSGQVYEYSTIDRRGSCGDMMQPFQVTGAVESRGCIRRTSKKATVAISVEHF